MKNKMTKDIKKSINNFYLAGLGVASLAQKETFKAYDILIKEGKNLETKSNKIVKKVSNKAESRLSNIRKIADKQFKKVSNKAEARFSNIRKIADKQFNRVENLFETRIEKTLKRLDIPTIKDIKGLSSKVDSLVKELKASAKKAA
ncbi:MAG: phasin family protein [Proteobacteria bacterium]|nr:phasin family protein [Pseudomonadota bacterium]